METSALSDFEKSEFTSEGKTKTVYYRGKGPAVLVLSEIPGITPLVAEFARMVSDRGLRVVMPSLFGVDGQEPTKKALNATIRQVCVSREFTLLATKKSSAVTTWLNALAHDAHQRNGGPGVGVIGMCLTGGFALAMMHDPVVVAPVLSQPALPVPLGQKRRESVQLSEDRFQQVKQRAAEGTCVMGLRFTGDKTVPEERFATLRRELGDKFIGVEIDSSPGNAFNYSTRAHSVLTEDLGPEGDTPTRQALEQVLTFFESKLLIHP
jgi:dienelactone hydrolase